MVLSYCLCTFIFTRTPYSISLREDLIVSNCYLLTIWEYLSSHFLRTLLPEIEVSVDSFLFSSLCYPIVLWVSLSSSVFNEKHLLFLLRTSCFCFAPFKILFLFSFWKFNYSMSTEGPSLILFYLEFVKLLGLVDSNLLPSWEVSGYYLSAFFSLSSPSVYPIITCSDGFYTVPQVL